jgi:AAA domain
VAQEASLCLGFLVEIQFALGGFSRSNYTLSLVLHSKEGQEPVFSVFFPFVVQGEESKVIIISMVRSNPAGVPGFLKSTNRANVLLSRAQHGMFIFGNADTICSAKSSRMWEEVLAMLKDGGRNTFRAVHYSIGALCWTTRVAAVASVFLPVRRTTCTMQMRKRGAPLSTSPRVSILPLWWSLNGY